MGNSLSDLTGGQRPWEGAGWAPVPAVTLTPCSRGRLGAGPTCTRDLGLRVKWESADLSYAVLSASNGLDPQ